jgi:hypothetical protein
VPRSYQAYPQNAIVTHSPANAGAGTGNSSPNSALGQGENVFQIPSLLDVCAGVTSGTANPFMSGLNDMGNGTGATTNTQGQTGNILSGLQIFTDSLCGFAAGGGSSSQVLQAARKLREQGGDVRETIGALRKLRATVGAGTTPQSVLSGVSDVNNAVNNSPMLALCGCGQTTSSLNVSGPLLMGDTFNPYAPNNVTPDVIISAAQAVADAIAANPMAANVIANGMPGASGNLGVAALNGVTAAAGAVQNDVSATSTLAQTNAEAISMQAINNANFHAVDRTLNAVFNISSLKGSTPDTVTITQDASEIGFITIPTSTTKTFGVFVGYKTGTLTDIYVNVYRVNSATQTLTLVSSSLNQTSTLSGNLGWIYAQLQTDIPVSQGQIYAVELAVQGSGSLTIVGMPNHWLMSNTNVYPGKLAAIRSTNVFDSSVAYRGTGSVTSGSYSHIIGALATAFFLVVNASAGGGSPTASVGGNAMTLLQDFAYSGGHLYVWVRYNPPTGSQPVSFTGLTSSLVSAGSVAFNGVTAAGTPVTASGSGTALSQTATGTAGGLLFQAFGYSAGVGTITGYSQTQAAYEPGSTGNADPLVIGYATATGSAQTFTATGSPSDPWGAVAIPLTATLPTVTAPSSMVAPTYSPNVPWLALSSVIPSPVTLTPATAPLVLTAGAPVVGGPTLWVLVDSTAAATLTLTSTYGLYEYTGATAAAWTLPSIAATNGLVLFLYNRGTTAAVTVTCAGADQIYRSSGITTSISLSPNGFLTLVNDGVYWLPV